MALAIVLVVFVAIIGAMVFAIMHAFKSSDPNKVDTSTQSNITTAQEFLPFEDIRDGMIVLGNHRYRAIVECSSTNYNLKTDREKEMIEASFQRFLNSLTYPVTLYVQTRVMDNAKMLLAMQEELNAVVDSYPQLNNYATDYFNEMNNLNSYIGNNKQKKKYVIVSFENVENLQNLSDAEKYDYCMKELQTRTSMIADGLSSIGVKATMLNTQEIAELVFSTYHKDNYSHVDNVINGEFLTMITEGETNQLEKMSDDARLDWILYEAQSRIENELIRDETPDFLRENFEYSIKKLDNLRDETSGYYKQKDPVNLVSLEDEAKLKNESFEIKMKKQVVLEKNKEGLDEELI